MRGLFGVPDAEIGNWGPKRLAFIAIGSALGGSFATGEPVTAVLTSLQGTAGVVIGFSIGQFVAPMLRDTRDETDKEKYQGHVGGALSPYAGWFGAALVPIIAGGAIDRGLIGLLIGGKIADSFV